MDYSPSGSYVHGIFQARILDPLLQGIFLTQESNPRLLCLLRWQAYLPQARPGKPLRAMHFQVLSNIFLVQSYKVYIEHNFTHGFDLAICLYRTMRYDEAIAIGETLVETAPAEQRRPSPKRKGNLLLNGRKYLQILCLKRS